MSWEPVTGAERSGRIAEGGRRLREEAGGRGRVIEDDLGRGGG